MFRDFIFLAAARPCSWGMAGGPWPMRTRSGRCLIFATRAADRVRGPRSGHSEVMVTVSCLEVARTMAGHGGVCGEHGLVPAAADESSRISSSSAANATISSSSVEPGVLSDGGAPSSGAAGGPAPAPDVGSAAWREACPALDRWGFELPAGGGGSPGPHSGGEEQARAS